MNHAVNTQPALHHERRVDQLGRRLVNWGLWCNYDADTGPEHPRCRSFESTHVAEIGDTTTDDRHADNPVPDIDDAEKMDRMIKLLGRNEQYVLALTYGGAPAVMRWRRLGDFVQRRALESAFEHLHAILKSDRQR